MPRHDMPPGGKVGDAIASPTVTVAYDSAKKTIFVALGVEVRRDKKSGVIGCLRCVRPACEHVNAARVHLGLKALPKVVYPEDEPLPAVDIGGVRVIPDKVGAVHIGYQYDLGDPGHTNEAPVTPPAALAESAPHRDDDYFGVAAAAHRRKR